MIMNRIIFKSPSKINLFLKIVNYDEDKRLHEIETVYIPLEDIYDNIIIESSNKFKISYFSDYCDINNLISPKNDLCTKSIDLYFQHNRINFLFDVKICKNIPIISGMGGGSSNAASILLILNHMYKKFNDEQLIDLAFKIGSDVPYFLNPKIAIGRNFGNELIRFNFDLKLFFVIVYPFFPITSEWAYSNKNISTCKYDADYVIDMLKTGDSIKISDVIYNDLSFSIYNKFPIVNIIKNDLISFGAKNVGITGSGPSLFTICDTYEKAKYIVDEISAKYKNYIYCKISKCLNKLYENQLDYYILN